MNSNGIIVKRSNTPIDAAIDVIVGGGTIVYPTDSVWAIGCDVRNEMAYRRIASIKGAKYMGKMVLLVDSIERLKNYVSYIHPRVETLLTFHKKPLTIIYSSKNIPQYATHQGTIAIRVSYHPLCQQLIRAVDGPIVSTAALSIDEGYVLKATDMNVDALPNDTHVIKSDEESTWGEPSVIATFDTKGELEFLRE